MRNWRWTREEDSLLGLVHDRDLARALGRTEASVTKRRSLLGIAAAYNEKLERTRWKPEEVALLGTALDRVVAKILGRTREAVAFHRMSLGIPAADQARGNRKAARTRSKRR